MIKVSLNREKKHGKKSVKKDKNICQLSREAPDLAAEGRLSMTDEQI